MKIFELFNGPVSSSIKWKKHSFGGGITFITTSPINNINGDQKLTVQFTSSNTTVAANAFKVNNIEYDITNKIGYGSSFSVNGNIHMTGDAGTKATTIFSQVISIMKNFLSTNKWDFIFFNGIEENRTKLYLSLAKILAKQFNATVISNNSYFVIYKT